MPERGALEDLYSKPGGEPAPTDGHLASARRLATKNFVDIDDELRGDPEDPESILGEELDELQARTRDKDIDYEADMRWAYQNLGNRMARPKDAPSFGAWTQLDYAKKNRPRFMEAVNRVLGKRVIEERKGKQDDSMEQEEMLRAFEKGMAEQA